MYTGDHTIDGAYYLFDENGVMQTNQWYQKYEGGNKYYLGNNGFAIKGWKKIDGKYYYFSKTATLPNMVTGFQTIDGEFYYFDENGVMQTSQWAEYSGHQYYFGTDGMAVRGWKKIDGSWYFFMKDAGVSPQMYTGIHFMDNNTVYCFGKDGKMLTGWQKVNNYYYYLGTDGKGYVKKWWKIDGKWYYFDSNGRMATGYFKIDDKLYHFDNNGVCLNP